MQPSLGEFHTNPSHSGELTHKKIPLLILRLRNIFQNKMKPTKCNLYDTGVIIRLNHYKTKHNSLKHWQRKFIYYERKTLVCPVRESLP